MGCLRFSIQVARNQFPLLTMPWNPPSTVEYAERGQRNRTEAQKGGPVIQIQKILVPTDFSEYSQHALKYAVALALSFKAKLFVVHVWAQPIVAAPTETFHPEIWVEAETAERKQLNQLTLEVRAQGIEAAPVFESG